MNDPVGKAVQSADQLVAAYRDAIGPLAKGIYHHLITGENSLPHDIAKEIVLMQVRILINAQSEVGS